MYIMIAHTLAKMQLDSIRNYANEMERMNTFKLEELSKAAEEDVKRLSEEEQDEYWDYRIDEFHEFQKTFPSLLRYSIVVSTYSTIEEYLLRIVKPHMAKALGYKGVLELNPNFNDKLRKLKYKGSLQNKLGIYMNKKMDIQFPFESEEWDFMEDLNIIRNNIVHCNGRIYDDQDHEKVQKVIKLYDTISISSSNEIVLEQEFILHMISQVEVFLSLIFELANRKK
ncbi:hypothetical protein FOC88_14810 [Bacillus thuringiensis]|uniref:RiboL-PSP-HEPN domain-containing protein n=1 Tax=Bacillus cereus TaxID=1396 RepID=A0ABD7RHQ4_BACCE|nr:MULTISPECIES: hypothetical protein [Bacillus cereus group]AJH82295.1 hypothetical protein BF36_2683 [Bacillus thuringiensis]MDF9625226.1 hypothetical protein [Bacillus cereus]MEB9551582.1 hypothetical protein [Bacillus cereus]MEB9568565.1 hypothetical protein [Bacillus cereus]QKI18859.1 hypothetical protein FOC88_14810 [Bacillus thuringiensis]